MAMITSMVPVSSRSGGEGGEGMDWYGWLSRARLEPAAAYQYGLVFTRNQLEEEDIPYLDHEFLLSMGVSVAKHRLEILKLARVVVEEDDRRRRRRSRVRGRRQPLRPVARLLAAADRTRRCLARCLRSLAGGGGGRGGSSALVALRGSSGYGGGRWGGGAGKVAAVKQERLLITDGRERGAWGTTTTTTQRYSRGGEDVDGEVRWDAMFQDLRPT